MEEFQLLTMVTERCIGCSQHILKQISKDGVREHCKDGMIPGKTCFRNTEWI